MGRRTAVPVVGPIDTIGKRVQALIYTAGKTVTYYANRWGHDSSTINKCIHSANGRTFSSRLLLQIQREFGCSMDWLVLGKGDPPYPLVYIPEPPPPAKPEPQPEPAPKPRSNATEEFFARMATLDQRIVAVFEQLEGMECALGEIGDKLDALVEALGGIPETKPDSQP